MEEYKNIESDIKRIDGNLFEVFIIKDDDRKVIQHINKPLKVELDIRDILQILLGSSILAVPVAFSEEVWDMGEQLPWINTILLSLISLFFLGFFIYFTAYRKHLKMFQSEFVKRVLLTFVLSVIVVGFLLTVVDKCPWLTEFDVAMKRTLLGAFPASLSATLTDSLS